MDPTYLLPRGVYRLPALGPNRETVLYAVNHEHRLLDPPVTLVRPGENPIPAMDHLWDRLNTADPVQDSPETLPATG